MRPQRQNKKRTLAEASDHNIEKHHQCLAHGVSTSSSTVSAAEVSEIVAAKSPCPAVRKGTKHDTNSPHLVRASPMPDSLQRLASVSFQSSSKLHVGSYAETKKEHSDVTPNSPAPPVQEISIPSDPESPTTNLPPRPESSTRDYQTLYLCAQRDQHKLQSQLSDMESENRWLKRQLIEWQRRVYIRQRNQASHQSAWSVPT